MVQKYEKSVVLSVLLACHHQRTSGSKRSIHNLITFRSDSVCCGEMLGVNLSVYLFGNSDHLHIFNVTHFKGMVTSQQTSHPY